MRARKSHSSQRRSSEVVAGRGHHGINAVAFASFEVIAAHPIMPARVGELFRAVSVAGGVRSGDEHRACGAIPRAGTN